MSIENKEENNSNNTPDSFDAVKKHLFKWCYVWFFRQRIAVRIVFVVLLLFLGVIAARLDFLGNKLYTCSKLVIPVHISQIDCDEATIPIIFTYSIEDSTGIRNGKCDDRCHTGDKIHLNVKVGTDCWISVTGIDSKAIYPVFNKEFGPHKIMGNQEYPISFSLDSTSGKEGYYLIAGKNKYDYKKDIEPQFDAVRNSISKGPALSTFDLQLSKGLTYQYIYFNHLP